MFLVILKHLVAILIRFGSLNWTSHLSLNWVPFCWSAQNPEMAPKQFPGFLKVFTISYVAFFQSSLDQKCLWSAFCSRKKVKWHGYSPSWSGPCVWCINRRKRFSCWETRNVLFSCTLSSVGKSGRDISLGCQRSRVRIPLGILLFWNKKAWKDPLSHCLKSS